MEGSHPVSTDDERISSLAVSDDLDLNMEFNHPVLTVDERMSSLPVYDDLDLEPNSIHSRSYIFSPWWRSGVIISGVGDLVCHAGDCC